MFSASVCLKLFYSFGLPHIHVSPRRLSWVLGVSRALSNFLVGFRLLWCIQLWTVKMMNLSVFRKLELSSTLLNSQGRISSLESSTIFFVSARIYWAWNNLYWCKNLLSILLVRIKWQINSLNENCIHTFIRKLYIFLFNIKSMCLLIYPLRQEIMNVTVENRPC